MPLTEQEKNKIKEEEEYRQFVKKGTVRKKKSGRSKGCLYIILLLFGVPLIIGIFMATVSPSDLRTSSEVVSNSNSISNISVVEKGNYLDAYPYEILWGKEKGKYVATFHSKFLPRNDTIVTGAMLTLVNEIYGKHKIQDLVPELVEHDGVSTIRFKGEEVYYYFLPIKEDTGEIHTLIFWSD